MQPAQKGEPEPCPHQRRPEHQVAFGCRCPRPAGENDRHQGHHGRLQSGRGFDRRSSGRACSGRQSIRYQCLTEISYGQKDEPGDPAQPPPQDVARLRPGPLQAPPSGRKCVPEAQTMAFHRNTIRKNNRFIPRRMSNRRNHVMDALIWGHPLGSVDIQGSQLG